MKSQRRWGTISIAGVFLGLLGCGSADNAPKLVPVAGAVTLNGQPLSSAHVTFMPTGETRGSGADGRTDADGVFHLKARHRGAGAVAGTYKVVINKMVKPDGSDISPGDATPPVLSGAKEIVPTKYSNHAATTLTATVPDEGITDLKFDIKAPKR